MHEEKAWCEFYEKYRTMIYAIGTARGLAENECEDLLQDVAVICNNKLQKFVYEPAQCRFRSFLYKITENVAFNFIRKKKKNQSVPLNDDYSVIPELDVNFMRDYEQFLLKKVFRY